MTPLPLICLITFDLAVLIIAAIDPSLQNNLILGFIALMSAITVYIQNKNKQKLQAIAEVADNTHTLVNSQMGAQLEASVNSDSTGVISAQALVIASQSLATLTKDPKDTDKVIQSVTLLQAARDKLSLSQSKLAEHQAKQAIVDKKPAGPAAAV
jgi:hypothetical protein